MAGRRGVQIVLTAPLTERIDHAGFFIQMSLASIPQWMEWAIDKTYQLPVSTMVMIPTHRAADVIRVLILEKRIDPSTNGRMSNGPPGGAALIGACGESGRPPQP